MDKEFNFSSDFEVPEDIREKVRTDINKWKQAYEARIQELQERINQLEFELRQNQNWENYQKGLYNFQTYYMNLSSEIRNSREDNKMIIMQNKFCRNCGKGDEVE